LSAASHPSTDLSVARTRVNITRKRVEKKILSAASRAPKPSTPHQTPGYMIPILLSQALSFDEFLGLIASCSFKRPQSYIAESKSLARALGPSAFTAGLLSRSPSTTSAARSSLIADHATPLLDGHDSNKETYWDELKSAIRVGVASSPRKQVRLEMGFRGHAHRARQ
jgi:hypothetical protein